MILTVLFVAVWLAAGYLANRLMAIAYINDFGDLSGGLFAVAAVATFAFPPVGFLLALFFWPHDRRGELSPRLERFFRVGAK